MIGAILIVIFSIVGLMALHEFGHFIVAKLFKIEVEEFGLGLPPRLIGKKIGKTLYSLNLIPFGAFVKIPSIETEKVRADGSKIENIPVYKRALILLAGVVVFWLIGILLFILVFRLGMLQNITDEAEGPFLSSPEVYITEVLADSPAELAGLKMGDVILEIKGAAEEFQEISKVSEVRAIAQTHQTKTIILKIRREAEVLEFTLVPRALNPEEGAIGVALVRLAIKPSSWFKSFTEGVKMTGLLTVTITKGFGEILFSLVRGKGLPPGVSFVGPIGLGSVMVKAVQVGLAYYLSFIGMIAVYLAVFNLLPIPALDGGKLLFLLIEKIKGSPIKTKTEQRITVVFFALLLLLMIWVTVKDIIGLF